MHAFILAGGFATRLWPLTEQRAKPLLPLAGMPLVEHLVRDIPAEIPVTISTNAVFEEAFQEWASAYGRDNVQILIEQTRSDDQKLGALGATAQWIEQAGIEEDILILAGDNYCGFSFDTFLQTHARQNDVTLIAVHDIGDRERAKSFGTVITEENQVIAFEEKPKEPKTTLVNTGCSILPRSVLPILREYAQQKPDDIGGIFEELLQRSLPINAFYFTEPWYDIGSFDAYLEATRALVGDRVLHANDAGTEECTCEGSVVLGAGTIARNSTLRNVVAFEQCLIENCELEDCILDRGCRLRGIDLRRQMLRQDTQLER